MLSRIQKSLKYKLPFVVYCKPNSDALLGLFQKDSSLNYLEDFTQQGFVLAPFDSNQKTIFIPTSNADFFSEKIETKTIEESKTLSLHYSEEEKQRFEQLVTQMISEISKGKIHKIVASRKEEFLPKTLDVVQLFEKLIHKYPTAFRYLFYHPEVGMWLGATPEKLVSIQNGILQTMAYAGTQKFEGTLEVEWQEKEREEQQFVTDFITKTLQPESDEITISNPYTSQAGTLLHIRTDISAKMKSGFSVKNIIEKLHPTPAVCGQPKDLAKAFILEHEGYNRKYYSGFLGELNRQNASELYVNLRCMEIETNKVYFYIGCGITKDSNPEKEFFETLNKSVTMKSLF